MTAQLLSFAAPVSGDLSARDIDADTRAEALHLAESRLWGTPAFSLIPGPLPTREGRRLLGLTLIGPDVGARAE